MVNEFNFWYTLTYSIYTIIPLSFFFVWPCYLFRPVSHGKWPTILTGVLCKQICTISMTCPLLGTRNVWHSNSFQYQLQYVCGDHIFLNLGKAGNMVMTVDYCTSCGCEVVFSEWSIFKHIFRSIWWCNVFKDHGQTSKVTGGDIIEWYRFLYPVSVNELYGFSCE